MTLRSDWDHRRSNLERILWIHIPGSHGTNWPKLHDGETLTSLNTRLAVEKEFAFDFSKAEFVHRVIEALREDKYTPDEFLKTVLEYNGQLARLFGPSTKCPEGYPPGIYEFEKSTFFDELPEDKQWCFFPVCFRGVWVSILAARIPVSDLSVAKELLPIFSSSIAEKLLTIYAKNARWTPFSDVQYFADAIGLISLAAGQCGLNHWSYRAGRHTFSCGSEEFAPYEECFDFGFSTETMSFIGSNDAIAYFIRVWRELEPSLRRFRERSRASVRVASAAIMSRNFSHNVGSHSLANPRLPQSLGLGNVGGGLHEDAADAVRRSIEGRLGAFHSYAQGRLDFLARAISESGNRSEPLFFLNDAWVRGVGKTGNISA